MSQRQIGGISHKGHKVHKAAAAVFRGDLCVMNQRGSEIGTVLTDAKTHDDAAADLATQAERKYRARDLPLVANRDNPKALGDFG